MQKRKTTGMKCGGTVKKAAGGQMKERGTAHSTGPRDKGTPTPVLRKQYMKSGGMVARGCGAATSGKKFTRNG